MFGNIDFATCSSLVFGASKNRGSSFLVLCGSFCCSSHFDLLVFDYRLLESDISEALWRLEISDNQDGGDAAESSPYPDRPGEPDCLYYMRTGSCSYGSNCRFNHPVYVGQV